MQESRGPATALPIDFESEPQLKFWQSFLLCISSALLLVLCYEPFNFYLLAWIAFVPMIFAFRARKDSMVFLLGTITGFIFLAGSLFWLRTIHFSVPFLLALLWSPLWGLWAWLTKKMCFYLCFPDVKTSLADARREEFSLTFKKYLILIFASSSIWVFFEWLRFWLFSGFPWNLLGVSQAYCPAILPLASVLGVLGISFLLIFVNLSISFLIESLFFTKRFFWQLLVLPIVFLLITFFLAWIPVEAMSDTTPLKVVLVQGNFAPVNEQKASEVDYLEQIQTYRNLSLKHAADKPDLIIWPETPIISSYAEDPFYQKAIKDVARICQARVLFGSIHKENDRKTNSAFFVDEKGHLENRYDKIHLVPYGEYTPMKRLLPSPVWNWLNKLVNMGNLESGNKLRCHSAFKIFQSWRQYLL